MASRLSSEHGMAGKVTSNCTFKKKGTPINKTETNWMNQADYEKEAALLDVVFQKYFRTDYLCKKRFFTRT